MEQERLALLALHLIPGVGSYTIRQLVSYCGSPSQVFQKPKKKLLKIPGVGPSIVASLASAHAFDKAEKLAAEAQRQDIRLLFHTDDDFPDRLRHIPDCPSLLYFRGSCGLNFKKVISIVGTRKATSYGKGLTGELIAGLASHDPLIVSGLAFGIDAEAHRQALKLNLKTVAVMAGGIDYIYPAVHRNLSHEITRQGGLLTENGISTIPDASRFPARNRIIAGLSDVVLVIEAAERGGALITAAIANDYDREVMAVPGNVYNKFSQGCNNLIRRHRAHLLQKSEDIEELMNWQKSSMPLPELPELTDDERCLVNILQVNAGSMHLDRLSWASRKAVGVTASLLIQLEFKEVVTARPGKIFELTSRWRSI